MADEPTNLLFGYAEASLDPKTGRFSIPANLFAKLGGETHLRMTVDPLGRFLEVRSDRSFRALVDRVVAAAAGLPPETAAALMTDYLGFSAEVQIDNVLRLVVPKTLREPLGDEVDLALVAVGDALRIWALGRYRKTVAQRRALLARDYGRYVNVVLGLPGPAAPAEPAGPSGVAE